jgi:hypothetical protein
MQNRIMLIVFLTALVLSIVGLYVFANPSDMTNKGSLLSTVSEVQNNDIVKKAPDNSIFAGKQAPGRSLVLDRVVLKNGGYVVVYENTPEPTGEILGTSKYLSAGEHVRVPVILSRDVKNGEVFNAMVHGDNGDKKFDITKDAPLRDRDGNGYFTNIEIQNISR